MELEKERARENLSKLIEKFEREMAADRIKEYNEEATKIAFIQPLLKEVLGWDVNDRDEVSPEEKISRGRVDYGLKVEGRIKVFIEAKPPRADLKRHIEQAVRYGYNRKGVPFVLLTDFEGFKLFDVTVKPDLRNPLKGLKIDLKWNEYRDKFDKLRLLSRESVIKGELDKLLLVKPKERLPVDKAILDDLKRWREALARDIFKNNLKLFHSGDAVKDADYLKEITQRILDRIIFMRSCEDRGLIHRRPLKELFEERTETVGTNTMVFLKEEFKHYNIIFNSDLFRPQEWEHDLAIDFKVMCEIVLETYNPYQFDVIPLEVLGNIYEQYLGYTIRLTDHQVKYELKPDVRKAGGVYYTPEYIVDYIVKNTVGKLLQELPASKVKKLRILDPACGSGSFLIRAYEEMLNYYRSQKKRPPLRHSDPDTERSEVEGEESRQKRPLAPPGHSERSEESRQKILDLKHEETELQLTIFEKSEILRNHIFGVDIDEQAVEVTKLSLMLKMLEGESGIIPGRAILPMLDKNIRCGNSLISGSSVELKKYFGDDWFKVKPFNWNEEFRKIMVEEKGFDAVIGNPPWGAEFKHAEKDYFIKTYSTISSKTKDSYLYFIKEGIRILNRSGFLGFIVPNSWLLINNAKDFRKELLLFDVKEIIDYGDGVFTQATVESSILLLSKTKNINGTCRVVRYRKGSKIVDREILKQIWLKDELCRIILDIDKGKQNLLEKLKRQCEFFERNCCIIWGIKPYQVGYGKPSQTEEMIKNRIYHAAKQKGKDWKPLVVGSNVDRYKLNFPGNQYIKYGNWLMYPSNEEIILQPKILLRQTSDILRACYDNNNLYPQNSIFIIHSKEINLKFLLGLLNSHLFDFIYQLGNPQTGKVFAEIKPSVIKQLPIHKIDFSNPSEKKLHDDLVVLVDVMLDLNKKIQTAKGNEKDQIQRQIEKIDREIDEMVYRLYNITNEERKIIESER